MSEEELEGEELEGEEQRKEEIPWMRRTGVREPKTIVLFETIIQSTTDPEIINPLQDDYGTYKYLDQARRFKQYTSGLVYNTMMKKFLNLNPREDKKIHKIHLFYHSVDLHVAMYRLFYGSYLRQYYVGFKDGNYKNIDVSNLMLKEYVAYRRGTLMKSPNRVRYEFDPDIYKSIPLYAARYVLASDGVLKSKASGKIISCILCHGYYTVCIIPDGEKAGKKERLHRLLYSTFKGPLIPGLVIDHIDRDPTNNTLENLRQVTFRENSLNRSPTKPNTEVIMCMSDNFVNVGRWYHDHDFSDYQLNIYGQYLNKAGKLRAGSRTSTYMTTNMVDKTTGRSITVCIHKLVASVFLPNPNNYPVVNHKNEKKLDNFVGNLEWCSLSYNVRYSGGQKVDQYTLAGEFIRSFDCVKEAADHLSMRIPSAISYACRTGSGAHGFLWKRPEVILDE